MWWRWGCANGGKDMNGPHTLPKITVIYNPVEGISCRDAEAGIFVSTIIEDFFRKGRNDEVIVGNSLIIDNFRLAIFEGRIGVNNIEFRFKDQLLIHDKDARFTDWPNGFCDYTERILEKLLNFKERG